MRLFILSCNYNAGSNAQLAFYSLLSSIESSPVETIYSIIDNKSSDYEITWLKSEEIKYPNVNFIFNDFNMSKAKALNKLFKLTDEKYKFADEDLIMSIDSDIKIETPDQINFFEKVLSAYNILQEHISCLVFNQSGHSLIKRQMNFIKYKDMFEYFVPCEGYGNGVAGGALLISVKNWKQISGYRENMGLYGGDDAYIMVDCFQQIRKPICVLNCPKVYHPFPTNDKYEEWKQKCFKQQLSLGKCVEEKGFFDNDNI